MGPKSGRKRPKSRKFPVFSLMIREFGLESGSHQTASSANESLSVCICPEMIEIRACAADFVWLMAAENASIGGFRRFAIGSIRGNRIRGHEENEARLAGNSASAKDSAGAVYFGTKYRSTRAQA